MTPRREAFVREYLVDFNATAAAKRAGYSPHTAEQQGSRLLGDVEVRHAIEAGQRGHFAALGITVEHVIWRAWEIACSDAPDRVAALRLVAKRFPEFNERVAVEHSGSVDLRAIDERRESLRAMLLAAGVDPELVEAAARGEVIEGSAWRVE